MSRHNPNRLTAKQEQALAALLSHPTVRDAAKEMGVTDKTLWNWLRMPHFKAAYDAQIQDVLTEAKQGWFSLARDAHAGMRELVRDPMTPAAVKLKVYLAALEKVEQVLLHSGQASADQEFLSYLEPLELAEFEDLIKRAIDRKQTNEMPVTPIRKQG